MLRLAHLSHAVVASWSRRMWRSKGRVKGLAEWRCAQESMTNIKWIPYRDRRMRGAIAHRSARRPDAYWAPMPPQVSRPSFFCYACLNWHRVIRINRRPWTLQGLFGCPSSCSAFVLTEPGRAHCRPFAGRWPA